MAKPKILIIDDSPVMQSMLSECIKGKDAEVFFANSGIEGIETANVLRPDIILLDIVLPDIHGFEVCKTVKSSNQLADIPIIFITSLDDDETLMKCFEAGGVDYIHKPFRAVEINIRIDTHLELARVHNELKKITRTDFLTKLYNRNHMIETINTEIARAERGDSPFSLIMGDIDKFKSINDTYGHNAGDYILKAVATLLQGTSRKSDVVARWGGEEFMLLLPNTDGHQAAMFADNMRKRINEYKYSFDKNQITCSITFGVKEFDLSKTIEQNISAADQALYAGKEKGRNCVVVAE